MIYQYKKPDLKTISLLATMYLLLGTNLFLYAYHRLPIPFHILISAFAIHLAFTIWHEAAHGTPAKETKLNHLIGILGIFPYSTPYFIQRHIHLLHHAKLNQQEDPNSIYLAGSFLTIPLRYLQAVGFMKKIITGGTDPRSPHELWIDRSMSLSVAAIYLLAIFTGHLRDIIILWTLPLVIAKLIMDWYINYIPHKGLPAHKYKGTRILDIQWLRPLILNHNYHAIHHLWPQLPWHIYYEVYKAKKDELIKNQVPIQTNFSTFYAAQ